MREYRPKTFLWETPKWEISVAARRAWLTTGDQPEAETTRRTLVRGNGFPDAVNPEQVVHYALASEPFCLGPNGPIESRAIRLY